VIEYPDSDGQPMSENTLQFQWIVTIEGGLEAVYRDDVNVFVAGDLLWYPVEGDPNICMAPDILVAFGRPKGYRGSYKQWEEDGIAPQVVFEILSPSNRAGELARKFDFYERYGVEEYYQYDPDNGKVFGWIRVQGRLQEIPVMQGWVSPRLQVRFELENGELALYGPDGRKFATYAELAAQRDREQREKEEAQRRAERLAAQLRALGIEPEA
jgi:Uma2 family endonuclease